MKQSITLLVLAVTLFSCTSNTRARVWGGNETINLNPGERLVNITWKQSDLWVLTKQDSTKPSTYTFKEKSSLGVLEGEIKIVEQ